MWFSDNAAGASLLRKFGVSDFKRSTGIFALASHRSIQLGLLKLAFYIPMLSSRYDKIADITPAVSTCTVKAGEQFSVPLGVANMTVSRLTSVKPYPVNLSYHLLSEQGEVSVFEAGAPLLSALLLKEVELYDLEVLAPQHTAGIYYLQLVQCKRMFVGMFKNFFWTPWSKSLSKIDHLGAIIYAEFLPSL